MNNHTKPTPEELEAGIKAAEQEALAATQEQTPETPEVEEPQEDIVTPEEVAAVEAEQEEQPAVAEEEAQEPQQDYKEKFVNSTREAQILAAKEKKLRESIKLASELPEPTEDELRVEAAAKGFSLEYMSEIEKALFKQSVINERKFSTITQVAKEGEDIDAWNAKVDAFIDDPKTLVDNPELEGKQEAFKAFSAKQTRRGVDFEDLVASFLYDVTKNAKPKQKGQMFERGTAGVKENMTPKDDKISLDDAATLRETNYNKYKEMLLAGKIADH